MKLKLLIVFLSVVVLLLMFGVGIAQGDDIGYPAPIEIEEPNYPEPVEPSGFYITSTPTPQPVIVTYQLDDGGYPVNEIADYSVGYPYPEPIAPQYVNGRNLWQEIVYQFSRLLELMK